MKENDRSSWESEGYRDGDWQGQRKERMGERNSGIRRRAQLRADILKTSFRLPSLRMLVMSSPVIACDCSSFPSSRQLHTTTKHGVLKKIEQMHDEQNCNSHDTVTTNKPLISESVSVARVFDAVF